MRTIHWFILYNLLVAVWIWNDAPTRSRSRGWAIGLFLFPYAVPYYLYLTRPGKWGKPLGIWLLGFVILAIFEALFLYE